MGSALPSSDCSSRCRAIPHCGCPTGQLRHTPVCPPLAQVVLDSIEAALNGKDKKRLDSLSSEFYSLIPHNFGRQRPEAILTFDKLMEKVMPTSLRDTWDQWRCRATACDVKVLWQLLSITVMCLIKVDIAVIALVMGMCLLLSLSTGQQNGCGHRQCPEHVYGHGRGHEHRHRQRHHERAPHVSLVLSPPPSALTHWGDNHPTYPRLEGSLRKRGDRYVPPEVPTSANIPQP